MVNIEIVCFVFVDVDFEMGNFVFGLCYKKEIVCGENLELFSFFGVFVLGRISTGLFHY